MELLAVANLICDGASLKILGLTIASLPFSIATPISLSSLCLTLFFYLDNGGNLDRVCICMPVVCLVRVLDGGL